MKKGKILLIIVLAILFSGELSAQKKNVTLSEIWKEYKFWGKSVYGVRSMNDGEHFTINEDGGVNMYSYANYGKKLETIVPIDKLIGNTSEGNGITIDDYSFSADEQKVLIETAKQSIYRHSYLAYYYVYNRKDGALTPVTDYSLGKIRLAEFSPDGKKIAFVRENDLFVTDLSSGQETQITTDGKKNEIINGYPDWVYEEEFSFNKGFEWSPNSTMIAFMRMDESAVKEYEMPIYKNNLYPESYKFKYPKAGETNSVVTVHVYSLLNNKTVQVNTGEEEDQYIPRIMWTADEWTLCTMRMNRLQNKLELLVTDFDPSMKKPQEEYHTNVMYSETSDTYIEITDNLYFLTSGKGFVYTSDRDGYNHIYLYDMKGEIVNQITKGSWDVESLLGIDEENGLVYYSSVEVSPMEINIYSISLSGKKERKLTSEHGHNRAEFSTGMKYFINYNTDANTPEYVTLHKSDGKQLKVLEDNSGLVNSLKSYDLSPKTFFKFKTSEGVALNGWMIKPPNFDPKVKYPVFFDIYGGPGINTVNDSWDSFDYMWHQMLAEKGYIIVSVDNRGTGYRGAAFKKVTYKQLGKYETIDQIEAAKYMASLDYVDANRIGVFGWSYGGFMAAHLITQGAKYFKMAISVAPVTNWRFYDSIYTERYNGLPKDNAVGYDDNSPINHVDELKGKYLLVHGSADDNVHYQNTMEMISALVNADKQFDLFIYPDKNHGIYGGNTRYHLYTKMTNFILDNL